MRVWKAIETEIGTGVLLTLGYFIMPIDLVPDFTPGGGYVDDLGVLAAAVSTVSMYIDAEVKETTRRKPRDWFGE